MWAPLHRRSSIPSRWSTTTTPECSRATRSSSRPVRWVLLAEVTPAWWAYTEKESEETMVVQLLCLPFAGAGASFFVPWRSDRVRVHAVQLPGRERRIAEEPYRDVHEAMDAALKELDATPEG